MLPSNCCSNKSCIREIVILSGIVIWSIKLPPFTWGGVVRIYQWIPHNVSLMKLKCLFRVHLISINMTKNREFPFKVWSFQYKKMMSEHDYIVILFLILHTHWSLSIIELTDVWDYSDLTTFWKVQYFEFNILNKYVLHNITLKLKLISVWVIKRWLMKSRTYRHQPSYHWLSGKLWYLQHICVGDTIVHH